jgi:phosphoglycolate phosphatase
MLLLGLEKLGSGAEDSLFVGDMTVDIQAARRAGLRVAVVATGSETEDQLKAAGPDLLASNLEDLAEILGA